ncbi:MAG: hypothetical protein WC479_00875 [Candidatus Izemoplasmatales bacterium]
MKLKLIQIVNGYFALQQSITEKLPTKLLFTLYRNMRLLQTEAETFEKVRLDLIRTKYGVKQKDKDEYEVPPENLGEFSVEMTKLGESEVELDIKIIVLEDYEDFRLSLMQLTMLEWMFVLPTD